MATRILMRRDTAANWASINPVLGEGEMGIELDTLNFKFGNGVTAWASLPYARDPDGTAYTLPVATETTLGGVKVGNGLLMDAQGVLSVDPAVSGGTTGGAGTTTDFAGGELTNVVLKQVGEKIVALGNISNSATLNLASGSVFTANVVGDVSISLSGMISGASHVFALILTNGGSSLITYPASFAFDGGSAPALQASGVDVLIGILDGSTWRVSRGWRAN